MQRRSDTGRPYESRPDAAEGIRALAALICLATAACAEPPSVAGRIDAAIKVHDAAPEDAIPEKPAFTEIVPLTVITYNVKHPTTEAIAVIADVIDSAGADLVALQESSPAETLAIGIASGMQPQPASSGLGILTSDPVRDTFWRDLGGGRGLFAVELGGGLVFATTHLDPHARVAQARTLAEILRQDFAGDPLIVGGDLNGLPEEMHPVIEQFSEQARWTVDYILVRGGDLTSWDAIGAYASDHFPVAADMLVERRVEPPAEDAGPCPRDAAAACGVSE